MRRLLARILLALAFVVGTAQSPPGLTWGPGPQLVPINSSATSLSITVPETLVNNGNAGNVQNTAFGINALPLNTAESGNTAFGYNALGSLNGTSATGSETAVGQNALGNATAGLYDTAVGSNAMRHFTTASGTAGNVCVGHGCMGGDDSAPVAQTGSLSTCVGAWACQELTTSPEETAVGANAGLEVQGGSGQNVFMGDFAGSGCPVAGTGCTDTIGGVTTPAQDVCVGFGACWTLTTATSDTAVGFQAGYNITTGGLNTFIGRFAGNKEPSGARNTCLGYQACDVQSGSNDTTALGANAGTLISTGTANTFVGSSAGTNTTTGQFNIAIGYEVNPGSAGQSHEINIGNFFFGQAETSVTPPVVSSCGTESIDGNANNGSGQVNITAGTPTSCTVTFANSGFTSWNHCQVTFETSQSGVGYSYTTTVLTITGSALTGKIDYQCQGV